MTITIGKMPGILSSAALNEGTTVAEALEIAGLSADGYSVLVDSEATTDFGLVLEEGSQVVLTKKIEGNA